MGIYMKNKIGTLYAKSLPINNKANSKYLIMALEIIGSNDSNYLLKASLDIML